MALALAGLTGIKLTTALSNLDHLYYGLNELDKYTRPSSMPVAER
jgi:hypothetical protein